MRILSPELEYKFPGARESTIFISVSLHTSFLFRGNKVPQTQQLKTTQSDYLTVSVGQKSDLGVLL